MFEIRLLSAEVFDNTRLGEIIDVHRCVFDLGTMFSHQKEICKKTLQDDPKYFLLYFFLICVYFLENVYNV